eukprot:3554378-Rhodomonas_salina.1
MQGLSQYRTSHSKRVGYLALPRQSSEQYCDHQYYLVAPYSRSQYQAARRTVARIRGRVQSSPYKADSRCAYPAPRRLTCVLPRPPTPSDAPPSSRSSVGPLPCLRSRSTAAGSPWYPRTKGQYRAPRTARVGCSA